MRIKELREEYGIKQKDVADAIHCDQISISRWERGKVLPSSDYVIKLADYFQVSADYLLGRSDDLGNVTVVVNKPCDELFTEDGLINQIVKLCNNMSDAQRERVLGYSVALVEQSGGNAEKILGNKK